MKRLLTEHAVLVGLVLRLVLAWLLPFLLDDGRLLPGVAYTDIDYHVFSDAADHVRAGDSPYDRHTYRYTPFLAVLLAAMPPQGGRYLFCLADTACGWIILQLRRLQRGSGKKAKVGIIPAELQDALWWLYNPLAINICTRGSAESLVVLLPVLATIWIITNCDRTLSNVALAGFCHGVAVHAKLYPIIYSLSYAIALTRGGTRDTNASKGSSSFRSTAMLLLRRLLTVAPLMFALSFFVTFVVLNYVAFSGYGPPALEEGLLYHFSRVDHRHNYSMHWYWIYLARAREHGASMAIVGRLLLLPQLVLLIYTNLVLAPSSLSLALFVQTFLFVAQNKVITAQYFTWYLCLLPLCSDMFVMTRRVRVALIALLGSVACWLGSAYCLEMLGLAAHRIVWVASVVFFAANVNLLGALLSSVGSSAKKKEL